MRRFCRALPTGALVMMFLGGCATLPEGGKWGENVTPLPGWREVGDAALDAVESPRF